MTRKKKALDAFISLRNEIDSLEFLNVPMWYTHVLETVRFYLGETSQFMDAVKAEKENWDMTISMLKI